MYDFSQWEGSGWKNEFKNIFCSSFVSTFSKLINLFWGLYASSFCPCVPQWSSISIIYHINSFLNINNERIDVPKIEPINAKQYEFKESPYPQADKLPFRSIMVSACKGAKVFLYKNECWKSTGAVWKELKVDNKEEQYLYDEYNPEALAHIIDTQHKVIEYQKKNKMKKLYSCLLIIDDFA